MQTKKLYQALVSDCLWLERCESSGNKEWAERANDCIHSLKNLLPSGSGIDCGTKIVECTAKKLVLQADFHHMDEHGFYDGWSEHQVIVTPSFDGIDMRITGRDRNHIKEHLGEMFHWALTRPVILDRDTWTYKEINNEVNERV